MYNETAKIEIINRLKKMTHKQIEEAYINLLKENAEYVTMTKILLFNIPKNNDGEFIIKHKDFSDVNVYELDLKQKDNDYSLKLKKQSLILKAYKEIQK